MGAMAVEPIFAGGQLPAHLVTTAQLPRGAAEVAPLQIAQGAQLRSMARELNEAAERAPSFVGDVGQTPTYDVRARVEPVPGQGRRRGSLFDRRA
jgi:hypothetical protein